jgi:hypothetical protein
MERPADRSRIFMMSPPFVEVRIRPPPAIGGGGRMSA